MYVDMLIKVNNSATDSREKIAGITRKEPYIEDHKCVIDNIICRCRSYMERQPLEKQISFEDLKSLLNKYEKIGSENGDYPYDTRYQALPSVKVDYFLKKICATFKDGCWPQDTLISTVLRNVYKRDCAEEQLKQQEEIVRQAKTLSLSLEIREMQLKEIEKENEQLKGGNKNLRESLEKERSEATKKQQQEEDNKKSLLDDCIYGVKELLQSAFADSDFGFNNTEKYRSITKYFKYENKGSIETALNSLKLWINNDFKSSIINKVKQEVDSKLKELELRREVQKEGEQVSNSSVKTETGSPFFYKFTTFAFFCTTICLVYIHYFRT